MPDQRDDSLIDHEQWLVEYNEFVAELERVCPDAANGLAADSPLPAISRRDLITVLRGLPGNAGVDVFISAWQAFAAANRPRSFVERTPNER